MAFEFTGSQMDGPDIDLIEAAGMALTDAQVETLWNRTSPLHLLRACPSVDEVVTEECDGMPGQSDEFYRYEVPSREQLAAELRQAIVAVLQEPERRTRRGRRPL